MKKRSVFIPILPSFLTSFIAAVPVTSEAKTRGTIIILTSLKNPCPRSSNKNPMMYLLTKGCSFIGYSKAPTMIPKTRPMKTL